MLYVQCPYCYTKVLVAEFGEHVYRNHHNIEMPFTVTKEYLDNRFNYVGLDYFDIGENHFPV